MKSWILFFALGISLPSFTAEAPFNAMVIQFINNGSGIAEQGLIVTRAKILEEQGLGNIALFIETPWGYDDQVSLCVSADWETLLRINETVFHLEAEKNAPQPLIEFTNDSCANPLGEIATPLPDFPVDQLPLRTL